LSLVPVYVALGSNLENPEAQVRAAVEALAMLPDTRLARVSSLYRSAAVGYTEQPDFVNAVAAIETALAPRALLNALLEIERRHGRVRDFQNAPRTLDLDIVIYSDTTVNEAGLTIPHPRMHERAFVLVPLAEIAPDALVPGRGRAKDLMSRLDTSSITRAGALDWQ
jgi:2-amino-4-hydroxy-6-hydroxymethyldihydropteridine diphosphokinase